MTVREAFDRRLDPQAGFKPLDFGNDGVTGSVDAFGRLVAVNTAHPSHGYVTLSTASPFDETHRYDAAVVRAYRTALAQLEGFGPRFDTPSVRQEAWLLAGVVPQVRLTFSGGETATSTTFAYAGGVVQQWQFDGIAPAWEGRLALQRSAYTQLTEGGPLSMPPLTMHVTDHDDALVITNPALNHAAAIVGLPPDKSWSADTHAPIAIASGGQGGTVTIYIGFGSDGATALAQARALAAMDTGRALQTYLARWRDIWRGLSDDLLLQRALVYGHIITVPEGEGACILTDHMLLPLSWNRDAYYVVKALAAARPAWVDVMRRHLLWLFETAERPDGVWGRCYLANGRIKDRAYQLDQQLFPLLELAEYLLGTRDQTTRARLEHHVGPVVEALLDRREGDTWLIPTDETPADDPVAFPYHLSSHILLWRTLRKLAQAGLGEGLADAADQVRRTIQQVFIAESETRRLYAYATDGQGHYHFYHDANDVPLVLAPVWGFVPASDPVWQATMDFAFSAANAGGSYPPGLGSIHTRAPWPLGDVQDMILARLLHDPARERHALERLRRAACWDGALPEAYDPATYEVASRHWFAWPNALYACVALGVFDGVFALR